jgi:hypothetical protein
MDSNQIIWLDFDYMNEHYEGEAIPLAISDCSLPAFDIYFNNEYNGTIVRDDDHWIPDNHIDKRLMQIISRKLSVF